MMIAEYSVRRRIRGRSIGNYRIHAGLLDRSPRLMNTVAACLDILRIRVLCTYGVLRTEEAQSTAYSVHMLSSPEAIWAASPSRGRPICQYSVLPPHSVPWLRIVHSGPPFLLSLKIARKTSIICCFKLISGGQFERRPRRTI